MSGAQAFAVEAAGRPRAIALLSGGLDSTLAIQAMLDQGIEVVGINFVGPFCTCSPRKLGGCHLASQVARDMGIEIRVIAKGMDYLRIVEHPRFGRGRGMNPCIDCRIFMLRKAGALMAETGASFVVTGEVLGQRPMSQHRNALDLIERESGLAGRLLRPLSAHLLEPTLPETEGVVERAKLLAIRGRGRKDQLGIARDRGIEVVSCGTGGCLLTDPAVSARMKDLFARCPDWDARDAKLTTVGRHLRLREGLKVILSRDEAEGDRLAALAAHLPQAEFTVEPGPLAALRGDYDEHDLETVGRLMRFFARKAAGPEVEIKLSHGDRERTWIAREPASAQDVARWMIGG